MTADQIQAFEKEYYGCHERYYFLVKEAKESKFRGLSSPMLLKEKLYQIRFAKREHFQSDFLFEECDYAKESTIRGGSGLTQKNSRNLMNICKHRKTLSDRKRLINCLKY